MTETYGQADLRALDREIAGLMGYKALRFDYADGSTDWGIVHESRISSFASCSTPPQVLESCRQPDGIRFAPFQDAPAYSSTWEGYGLLVEECERRGWDARASTITARTNGDERAREQSAWIVTGEHSPPCRAGECNDVRHAFALAMRDALKAAKEVS